VFDFIVIGIALIPASEAFSVLRALRILRVLRLVALVPSMRGVVRAMEEQVASDVKADVAEHQRFDAVASATILEELRALRTEVAELRERS
jgi:hypothetical protein